MIKCLCIDDRNKPATIPADQWVKIGAECHITYVCTCLPQKVLGFSLYEKPLTNCLPYEYFISTRFAIAETDLAALIELMRSLDELKGLDIEKLIEESNLQTV